MKRWPCWLKGGFVGIIVDIILSIPAYLCILITHPDTYICFIPFVISPMAYMSDFVLGFRQVADKHPLLWLTIYSILLSFVIGSIIGGLISLFKKKKSLS